MKKLLLLIFLPLIYSFSLSAQITQEQADEIVKERMQSELKFFTLHAKEEVQTGFEIITSIGETLELNYPCWVYYANYPEETFGKYLIVKTDNGNLLEVNTKNDEKPDGLEDWRIIPKNISFTEYSLSETLCLWQNLYLNPENVIVINSMEELENYILCAEGDFSEIDFSCSSLLLVCMIDGQPFEIDMVTLTQYSDNEYKMNVKLSHYFTSVDVCTDSWIGAFIVKKINDGSEIGLERTFNEPSIQLTNINFLDGELIVINNMEEFENYFEYPESNESEIDFSKHTLLLASGFRPNLERVIDTQLIKNGENEYELYVELVGNATMPSAWILKLLIKKLSPDTAISLRLN